MFITVIAGTDTYGAVRKVGKTPIVTKFKMLQLVPLLPVESYYLGQLGKESMSGVPLISSETTRSITGFRLARVDRLSVAMAYVRAVAAIVFVLGFLGAGTAFVTSFNEVPNPNNPVERYLLPVSLLLMGAGLSIALPSYLATYIVPEREKRIRQVCAELLGIAADPAHCDKATAEQLLQVAKEAVTELEDVDPAKLMRSPAQATREQAALLLCLYRAAIGTGGDRSRLERLVDELLSAHPN